MNADNTVIEKNFPSSVCALRKWLSKSAAVFKKWDIFLILLEARLKSAKKADDILKTERNYFFINSI